MEIKDMKIKIEDIIFWVLIIAVIGVAIWMLSGSPSEINAIITFAIFIIGSEILLWRTLFSIDKKTAISFEKMKNDINNKFLEVNNQLNKITSLIKNANNKI